MKEKKDDIVVLKVCLTFCFGAPLTSFLCKDVYMKIVIGSESFAPNVSGVAVFAERMAREMAKRGHEVYIFAPSRSFKTHYDNTYKDFKVFRLRSIANPFREGFRIALLPASEISREVQKIKPDIIHLQDPTAISGGLLEWGKKNKVPVIITNHFSMEFIIAYIGYLKLLHPIILPVVSWYISRFYNKCTLLTTPSPTARQKILKIGTKTEIVVISNGIDTKRFEPADNVGAARKHFGLPDKPVILYLGRIDKDKSIDVIIKAIPLVVKEVDAHFAIAGGGDELPRIKSLVQKMGVEKSITFLGRIDHESNDLPLAYQAASIFAMPSCIETQSIVTLEALSSGLPLVAANATSMPEFTDNGKNGLLFDQGDSKMMAERIVTILKDPTRAKSMGQGSREYAKVHSIGKTYDKFEKLYNLVVKRFGESTSHEIALEFNGDHESTSKTLVTE